MTIEPVTLATVRGSEGGATLHVWRDGREVARVPLTVPAALRLAADLLQRAAGQCSR